MGMETYAARLASFDVAHPAAKKRTSSTKSAKTLKWPHKTPLPVQVTSLPQVSPKKNAELGSLQKLDFITDQRLLIRITQPASYVTIIWMDGRRTMIL